MDMHVDLKKSALLVVDMQEDFCPPTGRLAVDGARDIAPLINELLTLPFSKKIATRDFHPSDHVSFETSHPPDIKAFQSTVTVTNPWNFAQTQQIPVWPSHCIQGTRGAETITELDVTKLDHIIEKGRDSRVEMFSVFADGFGNKTDAASQDAAKLLRSSGIEQIVVVGVAGEHCVSHTAHDAKKEGFDVLVVEEAIRSVDPGANGWLAAKENLKSHGIKVISVAGPELVKVRDKPS